MAQAENRNDVSQQTKSSRSKFNNMLSTLSIFLNSLSEETKGFIGDIETEILDTAQNHFLNNENNWYILYLDNYFNVETLLDNCSTIDSKHFKHKSNYETTLHRFHTLCCLLSLEIYRYRLIFFNQKQIYISPSVISYIPDNIHRKEEPFKIFYIDWLNVPVEVANRNGNNAIQEIKAAQDEITRLSTHITDQTKKTYTEFETKRSKLIDEISSQTQKYENVVKASFNKLEEAYGQFEKKKEEEKDSFKKYCQYIGTAVVAVAIGAGLHGNALELYSYLTTAADKKSIIPNTTILSTLGFLTAEVFLIYLFRISLNNFYAARDELLQIQMRKALCKFAPQFKAFACDRVIVSHNDNSNNSNQKESQSITTSDNLDEFAKHIFSPINSRMNPTPHPLDFLGQVTDAVKKAKK